MNLRLPLVARMLARAILLLPLLLAAAASEAQSPPCHVSRGTGDLGIIIERADGAILVIDTSALSVVARVEGLGDLSHASAVFSRDMRYAFVFGRDGGLTKVDLLCPRIVGRTIQAGNSIGGAISQDGTLVAVSNYKPGGVRVFDAATLQLRYDIPAGDGENRSKVVGLVDAPERKFVFSLYDHGEIWVVDLRSERPRIERFRNVGLQPYDALLDPQGRFYIAGLFGEDGMALVDLWHTNRGVRRIVHHYGRGDRKMPVYKMPHLEGWAIAGSVALVPAVGRHEVLVLDTRSWTQTASIAVAGQPVFVMARPDGRQAWVNFALPHNNTLQIVDIETQSVVNTLTPGKGVLHMEFTPRGEHVWVSVRDENRVDIYDAYTHVRIASLEARKPSGIFFTARAHKTGL